MTADERAALATIRARVERLTERLMKHTGLLDEAREAAWIAKAVEAVETGGSGS